MTEQHGPFARDGRPVCGVCPSLRLPGGHFDVVERPSRDCPFDPATGHRFTAADVPVCVHPDRVGLPAAPYATHGLPLPWETPPPVEAGEVPAWVRAALDAAPPEACADLIRQATEILLASDPGTDVTAVLRAALS
ncbi:hypothetical protein SAMN04490357_0170 [Streptomyces misionensis]|uniref:Uncharacterized protein n=1 Tax=Streptomyces misionensis TaxID=67331 RepID=A0A1H4IBK7_9ACTN|nr:hypothetical protein [Streptomyces misionensis]SEB31504.1 hypothetical protein SAMN04490357_0170 [Streptomyces misionensis]